MAVRYGLENLNTVHDARSDGLINNHRDSASIIAPKIIVVIKYIKPN